MGNSKEKNQKNKIKVILKDIHSEDDKKIIKALNSLKIHGDDEVIQPIVEVWNKGVSLKVEQAIINFISDIKSSTSSEIIMGILENQEFNNIHAKIMTTIWNSNVDYSAYLSNFVSIACQNEFPIVLECLTIIENMHGPFEEHQLLDAEVILREYVKAQEKESKDSYQKVQLLNEINMIIAGLNDHLDGYEQF